MFRISTVILERELIYQGKTILKYKIQYPKIIDISPSKSLHFNEYNEKKALELKKYAETELFENAIQQYKYDTAHGYPIMVYELVSNYTVTYNDKNIISLYIDDYTFSGGAHGNTIRSSQNWNMQVDRQFMLKSLYPNNPYFLLSILKEINSQIESQMAGGNPIYFEDYCKLVLDSFNPEQFYLVPRGNTYDLVIYFQQYDIAPYSTGIPTFQMKI